MFTSVLIKDLMNKKYALSAIAFSGIMSSAAIFPAEGLPKRGMVKERLQLLEARIMSSPATFPAAGSPERGMVRERLQLLEALEPFSCPVCLEDDENKLVVLLPCAAKHQMCVACAHRWHIDKNKNECVTCRQDVSALIVRLPRLLAGQQALDKSANNSHIRVVQQSYQERIKEHLDREEVLIKSTNHARKALADRKPNQATLLVLKNKNLQLNQARATNQRRIGELSRRKEELTVENANLKKEFNFLDRTTLFFFSTTVISISMLAIIGGVKLYGRMRGGNKGGYQD